MSNEWFVPANVPVTQSRGTSSTMRAEFASVEAAFDKLPTPAQTWGGRQSYVAAGGSTDAWTAAIAATYLTSYADGMTVRVKFAAANTSESPTLNLNALGAKTIGSESGSTLAAGNIAAGEIVTLIYNATYDKWTIVIGATTSQSQSAADAAAASAADALVSEANALASEQAAADSETAAANSATTAQLSENGALAAQSGAEAALASSFALSGLYATTAAGLAATAANGFFGVPSSASYESIIIYQDVAGVAVDTGKRITNVTLSDQYPDLEISLDAFGNVYKRVDPEGQLYLGTDTTSIQQQIRDNRAGMVRFAGRALGAMAETYTNTDARDLVRVDAQALDTSWGAPAYTNKAIVQYGDATYMWRHPMMVKIARNQMLLFANKIFYNLTRGVGDIDGSTIQVCNITFDEAKKTFTQGAWRSIADYSAITGTFISGDGPPRAAATHMTACRLRSGANKGRIVMIFSTNKALPSSTVQQLPFFTYSDDSGQTWSTPVALTIGSIGSPGYIYSGNGRMIQLRYNNTYRNRILSAHYFDNGAGNTFFASVYSDDGGATWTRGSAGPTGTNETQYAEDIDGTIYAQSRADGTGSNVIYYRKSTDGGVTWSAVGGGTLAGNGSVQCSLVQCADEHSGVPRFFRGYSDPTTSPTTRERMTVALSYDAFTTAAVGTPLLLEGAPWFTAYSSIEMWNEQDALCVYESKPTQLAIAGTVGPGLKCASFNARSILG